MRRAFFPWPWLALALLAAPAAWAGDILPLTELAKPGRVLLLRHAYAPGTGDPPGFRLDDCASQRNLDASGRAQASALGERLKRAGIARARVYSSQWCRCRETARLLQLGEVQPLPALNSFYGRAQERDARVAALRSFLAALAPDGVPVVMVTHQYTITALTGAGTPSGGGSIFELNGSDTPRRIGAIEAD
ncbi:MAG: histidine phosphatase family protein [Burkholderiales bacterium]|nr:histidine phosphatase family protein [Burkholderiales bacterium]